MTIIIPKKRLYRFFAISLLAVLAAGVLTYISPPLPKLIANNIPTRNPELYYREHALFFCIVAVLIMIPEGILILRSSRNITKEL